VLRRFLIIPLFLLLLLLSACADKDNPASGSASPVATASVAAQNLIHGTIVVKFEGSPVQKATMSVSFAVEPGAKAWDAIQKAVGASNVTYKDYGGDLGILIVGLYGVEAAGNHFWEFVVNGKSSDKGVSGYTVQDGDVLEFRYSAF
jgi:hypothetical protein